MESALPLPEPMVADARAELELMPPPEALHPLLLALAIVSMTLGFGTLAGLVNLPRFVQHPVQESTERVLGDMQVVRRQLLAHAAAHEGQFPADLAELGQGLRDPWGQPFRYSPPVPGQPGRIMSLGADAAPGGTGEASDLSVSLRAE